MKLLLIALSTLASIASASAAVVKPAPRKAAAATTACFPPCLEDLKAMCVPSGTCTRNLPATQSDTAVSSYCFMNGVKIGSSVYNETRTKPDGSLCYSVDIMVDSTGTKYQYMWKNGAGALVATESLDYADMGGRYHTVTCGGTTTMVDMATPACEAEEMALPQVDVICTTNDPTCTLSAGAGGAGGMGGMGGAAPPAGGSSGQGGAVGAGGAPGGQYECAPGQAACDGVCINSMIDPANCGACGVVCSPGFSCMQGACTAVNTCKASTETMCNGKCTDITTDSKNCGACGAACPVGQVCIAPVVGGVLSPQCAAACTAGMLMCGGDCKPARDDRNCGSCDTVCGPTQICCSAGVSTGGLCLDVVSTTPPTAPYTCQSCPTGLSPCDSQCIDLKANQNNCGQCGVVCEFGCTNGVCNTMPPKDSGGSCSVSGGPVSGRGTLLGLLGAAVVLGGAIARRGRRARR